MVAQRRGAKLGGWERANKTRAAALAGVELVQVLGPKLGASRAALDQGALGVLALDDHVDLEIRAGGPATGSSSFIARKLGRSPRVLVASPSYLRERGKPRTPAALREHDALVTLSSSGPQHLRRALGSS